MSMSVIYRDLLKIKYEMLFDAGLSKAYINA